MKMVIFNIKKGDKCKEYNLDIHTTIEDLKNKIISDFSLPVKYIDIEFLLERPIRTLGRFNLEPGILPRPLDMYSFERFGLEGRTVNATFTEVDDYTPLKNKRGTVNLRKKIEGDNNGGETYDLKSESDFPPL